MRSTTYKEECLDTVEKYHIYQKIEKGIQINSRSTIAKNKIFDINSETRSMTDGTPPSTHCR
jgi:hypothetical protein